MPLLAGPEFLFAAGQDRRLGEYDGYGDSGSIESFTFLDRHGRELKVAPRMAERVDDLACAILPGGWEINEGSMGTITLNVMTRRIHVDHKWRIESTEEESFGFDL